MLIESFGAIIVPINEETDVHLYIRQDGHTKCVAVSVGETLQEASVWTNSPSDCTHIWVSFQETTQLQELIDESFFWEVSRDYV